MAVLSLSPMFFWDSSEDEEDQEMSEDIIVILTAASLVQNREKRASVPFFMENVILHMKDLEFRRNFRLSPKTFDYILENIQIYLLPKGPGGSLDGISPQKQLLLFLWYLSNQDSMREIAVLFGVSESSVHKIVRQVSKTLADQKNKFIKWPTSEQRREISDSFKNISGFDGILGAFDGTHIRIVNLPEGNADYYNRKKYPSIQLQLIVDNLLLITNAYVGWPGSAHDARVFRNSGFATEAENGLFQANQFVIGDSAYPLLSYLVTVFKDNGHLARQHKLFNTRLSACRQVVERAIGHLKGRFRLLRELYCTEVEWICQLIVSACVLHNMCILSDDDVVIHVEEEPVVNNYGNIFRNHPTGIALRNRFLQTVPMR